MPIRNNFFDKFGETITNRLKRFAAVCASVGLISAFALTGCEFTGNPDTASESVSENDEKINVVATIYPQYDFSRQIAGDCANVTMLLGPGEESHTYEPTPQDIITIQNADVFIYVGGESESWVDSILDSVDIGSMEIISLMECVDPVEEELVEGMEDDEHEHDEYDEHDESADSAEEVEYDEHVWTSVDNAQIISQAIADALCDADKANEETYRTNCEKYLSELSNLKKEFNSVVNSAQRNTIVFGDRFPLRYFADEFGLEYYAAFPGCSEQSEPSAGTVAFLVEKVREEKIPVVFSLELSNGKIAQTIAESTGAEVLTFQSCHNITMDDFQNGITYIDLMEQNVEVLKKALN